MDRYPPLIAASMPAFNYKDDLKLIFQFPQMAIQNGSYSVDYTVASQLTNRTVMFDDKGYAKDIATTSWFKDEHGLTYITIPVANINQGRGWDIGSIYKIQIRFRDTGSNVSEWSTVCYVKSTGDITLSILNEEKDGTIQLIESPTFAATYKNEKDESETQSKYRWQLFSYEGALIEDSLWQTHNQSYPIDIYTFGTTLEDFKRYKVKYSIETKNKYQAFIEYSFLCAFSMLINPENITIEAKNDYDNGAINIAIQNDSKYAGNLILRRTSSRSSFSKWEDYYIFNILDTEINLSFIDYLVENGTSYIYGIQSIESNGFRGALVKTKEVLSLYEDIFLVGDNRQLKIKYNPKVSGLKRTIPEQKQETIGSQYPTIMRNGNVNYFTFNLGGLISYGMDEASTFCSKKGICGGTKITTVEDFNTNLVNDNIIIEREFRNQAEEFLSNGSYKFFKSPTEGVMMIAITAVSLNPEEALGRMIYSFTSTAYEIGDISLTNVLKKGIIGVGEWKDLDDMGYGEVKGYISATSTTPNQDIYAAIKESVYAKKDEYEKVLDHLTYLKIELVKYSNNQAFFINDRETKIIILDVYELDNVIDITGLWVEKSGVTYNITFEGQCKYHSTAGSGGSGSNLQAVSSFGQLYDNWSTVSGKYSTLDVVSALSTAYMLKRFYNFTYLKIDADAGTKMIINGQEITVGDTGSIEYRDQSITEVKFVSPAVASVTFIYNGFK